MNKILISDELRTMIRNTGAHAKAGTMPKADSVLRLPAKRYFDPEIFAEEVDKIFKRVPLMLAASAELPNPGDFKTMEAVGVPVLIVRGPDGVVRSFVNSCTHRGTNVEVRERGNARRFVCPYHAWTFTQKGELMGVAVAEDFGEVDKSCLNLKELPTCERSGLIWVILKPGSDLSFDDFLAGYDKMLASFGFDDWKFHDNRVLKGPNWKIAYDGYLDFYHLPFLHKDSFGEDMYCRGVFYGFGPHTCFRAPTPAMAAMLDVDEDSWSEEDKAFGVWTIFPHISIASFFGGCRGVMISQLMPGKTVSESYTTQIYLTEREPTPEEAAGVVEQFKFLEHVVKDEDYATGIRQQSALENGGTEWVLFGRNEAGAQRFHTWVDDIVAADDEQLKALFKANQGLKFLAE